MKTIKKLSPLIIPHLTHLVNAIIHTEIYPSALKLSRISPLLKPDKNAELIDSFRIINNLSVIDKIVEQFLKDQLNDFLEIHNIINDQHHGSHKEHSTLTALALMNHKLLTKYHNNSISTIIQTDLSAAFDMVDHKIFIQKLEHYGIRGKFLRVLESFLSKRFQYVSIDSLESDILPALECSVIQGSKLFSLMYTLYINEVPLISKLMNTKLYILITNNSQMVSNNITDHTTIQYVDDSNNIITSENSKDIKEYINKYFKLLEGYYNLNKLKLNPDKSKLMIMCKPQMRKGTNDIKSITNEYTVEQVSKIKALGVFITAGLTNHAMVNHIISKVKLTSG